MTVGKLHQQHTVTDAHPSCVQPLLGVCWETEDCKYESVIWCCFEPLPH